MYGAFLKSCRKSEKGKFFTSREVSWTVGLALALKDRTELAGGKITIDHSSWRKFLNCDQESGMSTVFRQDS